MHQAKCREFPTPLEFRSLSFRAFFRSASRRSVFILYDTATEPVQWSRVETIANDCAIPNVSVLKGGIELWLSKHQADGVGVALPVIAGTKRYREQQSLNRPISVSNWCSPTLQTMDSQ